MSGRTSEQIEVLDVLGVGFGPSNMALAIALDEYNSAVHEADRLSVAFLEKRATPEWHPGMLFDDASMQISFLKDLTTFRNPQSPYTFVNFLKSVGRLVDFTNRGSIEPLRVEFSAYLRWVADQLSAYVRCSSEVCAVRPVIEAGEVVHFEVDVAGQDGRRTVAARRVIVAAGLQLRVPPGVTVGERIWHSHHHLARAPGIAGAHDVVVVGSGQSAVEVALDLYARLPEARVHLVSSRYGIAPSDQGPLVNQIFDPSAVDDFFGADPVVRARMDRMHRNSNNAVANPQLIRDVFDIQYRDRWLGRERLMVHRMSRTTSIREECEAVDVEIAYDLTGSRTALRADAVVLATGYTTFDITTVLGEHAGLVRRGPDGLVDVDRDCRAWLTVGGPAALYLVGQTEHLHGFANTLLSTIAVRAGEIADSILTGHLSRHIDPQERSHA